MLSRRLPTVRTLSSKISELAESLDMISQREEQEKHQKRAGQAHEQRELVSVRKPHFLAFSPPQCSRSEWTIFYIHKATFSAPVSKCCAGIPPGGRRPTGPRRAGVEEGWEEREEE